MRASKPLISMFVFSAFIFAANNPFLGTWKLNAAKSKGTPGTMNKEGTQVFEAEGDQVKRTFDAVDADGQRIHMSGTIPWDGKEHKVDSPNGLPPAMVAVKKIDERTIEVTVKANGKIVVSGRSVVSKDGKTMTSSFKGQDPKGRNFNNVEVMEKQ